MGMSASQARFLSLTARKTNVEYEGQQINQQRTALSNQSSNYYSQLTSLSVPTPPSSADYTKVSYTFKDGTEQNTVTSLIAKANGEYRVNYIQQTPADGMVTSGTNIVTRRQKEGSETDYTYAIGAIELRNGVNNLTYEQILANYLENYAKQSEDIDMNAWATLSNDLKLMTVAEDRVKKAANLAEEQTDTAKEAALEKYYSETFKNALPSNWAQTDLQGKLVLCVKQTADFIQASAREESDEVKWFRENEKSIPESEVSQMSDDEIENLIAVEKQYLAMLQDKYNQDAWKVKYNKNSMGVYDPVFYSAKELATADYSEKTGASLSGIKTYSYGETTETKEVKNARARVEQDTSGRYISIMLYDDEEGDSYTKYDLTTTTEADEAGYNDAMNQYYYDKAQYEQKIHEVNSKIEIIQVQDKNLELKLKQLDTEENAISTEIDAVKKVISKNVESSFKTFNA